jgi:hypothetical protein
VALVDPWGIGCSTVIPVLPPAAVGEVACTIKDVQLELFLASHGANELPPPKVQIQNP